MSFSAVLFDVGETLWHSARALPAQEFRRIAADRCRKLLAEMRIDGASAERVARVAWDAVAEAAERARATDLVEPDYAQVARAALVADGLPVSRDDAAKLIDAIYVSGADGGKEAYPEARAVLGELRRRGLRLAIVTNRAFGGERFRADLRKIGLDVGWDAMAVSVEVGFLKPHPRLFKAALDALDISASQALMVGNSLTEDIRGAHQLGIRAAWRRCVPDAEGVIPDFSFDALDELLHIPGLEGGPP